jgi:hypothetical protein
MKGLDTPQLAADSSAERLKRLERSLPTVGSELRKYSCFPILANARGVSPAAYMALLAIERGESPTATGTSGVRSRSGLFPDVRVGRTH